MLARQLRPIAGPGLSGILSERICAICATGMVAAGRRAARTVARRRPRSAESLVGVAANEQPLATSAGTRTDAAGLGFDAERADLAADVSFSLEARDTVPSIAEDSLWNLTDSSSSDRFRRTMPSRRDWKGRDGERPRLADPMDRTSDIGRGLHAARDAQANVNEGMPGSATQYRPPRPEAPGSSSAAEQISQSSQGRRSRSSVIDFFPESWSQRTLQRREKDAERITIGESSRSAAPQRHPPESSHTSLHLPWARNGGSESAASKPLSDMGGAVDCHGELPQEASRSDPEESAGSGLSLHLPWTTDSAGSAAQRLSISGDHGASLPAPIKRSKRGARVQRDWAIPPLPAEPASDGPLRPSTSVDFELKKAADSPFPDIGWDVPKTVGPDAFRLPWSRGDDDAKLNVEPEPPLIDPGYGFQTLLDVERIKNAKERRAAGKPPGIRVAGMYITDPPPEEMGRRARLALEMHDRTEGRQSVGTSGRTNSSITAFGESDHVPENLSSQFDDADGELSPDELSAASEEFDGGEDLLHDSDWELESKEAATGRSYGGKDWVDRGDPLLDGRHSSVARHESFVRPPGWTWKGLDGNEAEAIPWRAGSEVREPPVRSDTQSDYLDLEEEATKLRSKISDEAARDLFDGDADEQSFSAGRLPLLDLFEGTDGTEVHIESAYEAWRSSSEDSVPYAVWRERFVAALPPGSLRGRSRSRRANLEVVEPTDRTVMEVVEEELALREAAKRAESRDGSTSIG
ncbi:hypothetical protein DFJ74DRAFT_663336 [Hyaloraphidium curvatum]|nr:hypothetical protein DFJ74DRAFT_663336 [Hyaloraphidium curvatum]